MKINLVLFMIGMKFLSGIAFCIIFFFPLMRDAQAVRTYYDATQYAQHEPMNGQDSDTWLSEQIASQLAPDPHLISRLLGRILLQAESHGEAWYVDPVSQTRIYLKDGPAAYQILHTVGLGITEMDYQSLISDNAHLRTRLQGRIVLRVQAKGEAYYIDPNTLRLHYFRDGESAYRIMRELSLGITTASLNRIPIQRIRPSTNP